MEENATRRNLKVKEQVKKKTTLFDAAESGYINKNVSPESAFFIREASDAAAGLEIFFGVNRDGCEDEDLAEEDICSGGARGEQTQHIEISNLLYFIYYWSKSFIYTPIRDSQSLVAIYKCLVWI